MLRLCYFVEMSAVHIFIRYKKWKLHQVHLDITVEAKGHDTEREERRDLIGWAQCTVGET